MKYNVLALQYWRNYLRVSFNGLFKRNFGHRGIFTGSGLGLQLDGLGVFNPDQSKLSQHCNNTIITENKLTAALLHSDGDTHSEILPPCFISF